MSPKVGEEPGQTSINPLNHWSCGYLELTGRAVGFGNGGLHTTDTVYHTVKLIEEQSGLTVSGN